MLTAALLRMELQYLQLLKHELDSIAPSHTIMMKHMWVKYQVVHVPTGVACGVKSITCINNYSIAIVNLLALIEAARKSSVCKKL